MPAAERSAPSSVTAARAPVNLPPPSINPEAAGATARMSRRFGTRPHTKLTCPSARYLRALFPHPTASAAEQTSHRRVGPALPPPRGPAQQLLPRFAGGGTHPACPNRSTYREPEHDVWVRYTGAHWSVGVGGIVGGCWWKQADNVLTAVYYSRH